MESKKILGVIAQFDQEEVLLRACRQVRDKGFKEWDAYSPYPIHGMTKACGFKPSPLPVMVLTVGFFAGAGAFLLWSWMNAVDYKYVIAGKPFFSWEVYALPGFEVGVLSAAFTCLFGLLALCKLPLFVDPVLEHPSFKRATDDLFYISIESRDPFYDSVSTPKFLKELGASLVDTVEEDLHA